MSRHERSPRRAVGDKREAILAAATELFVERGFHGTTVPEIAERAGVGAGTIYRHFASKEAVVNELFRLHKQALTARVEVPNPQNRWAPGLYVTGEVTLAQKTAALAVRSSAIQMIEDRPVVFVQSDGQFSAHPVTLGKTDGERTEVLQGLAAGDTYVATNSYVIKAELRKSEAEED